jgi:hypothetical protein
MMTSVGRIEEEAAPPRQHIVDVAIRGEEVPEALILAWSESRSREAELLKDSDDDTVRRRLGEELVAIEERLQRIEEGAIGDRSVAAALVVECGERIRWNLWLTDSLAEELTVDPLALIEEELRRLEIWLGDLPRFDAATSTRVRSILDRVHLERRRVLEGRLLRYIRTQTAVLDAGRLDRARRHWIAVGESFQVESDIVETGGDVRSLRMGGTSLEELHAKRNDHLETCSAALRECTGEEVEDFFRTSLADLLDHISGVLSEGDAALPDTRCRVLDLVLGRIGGLQSVLGDFRTTLARRGALQNDLRRRFVSGLKQLERARRQVMAARREVQVQHRLERTFGAARVRLFERFILILVVALLGLVFLEWRLERDLPRILGAFGGPLLEVFGGALANSATQAFLWIDLGFCIIFQIDFFVRWAFAGFAFAYFLRHFFAESLPALPYGLLFHHLGVVEEARSIIAVRLLRARGLVAFRAFFVIFIRVFRVTAFFMRGIDQAVDKLRGFLDRDVIFFEAGSSADPEEFPLRRRALALEARRQRILRSLYQDRTVDARTNFVHYQAILLGAEARSSIHVALPYRRSSTDIRSEVRVERVIYNFIDCDVARAVGMVGRDGVEKIARWLRFLDVPGFRHIPLLRRIVPAARFLNPAEAASAAISAVGQILQELLRASRFWIDLAGITTGPQILDRLGSAIVLASKRPAVRLMLFGSLFLFIEAIFGIFQWRVLTGFSRVLGNLLGLPILLLGSVCLVFFLIGRWFKRISGEALDYYLRTADAQFYTLVKTRKARRLNEDLDALYENVFAPEIRLRSSEFADEEESKAQWKAVFSGLLASGEIHGAIAPEVVRGRFRDFGEEIEAIGLLYQDFLDSPVLHRLDDNTSVQILGNLSLQNIRLETLRVTGRDLRRLEKLSLDRGSMLDFGPYFWFRFITESLAIETAKLILEYNTACIPIARHHFASPERLARFKSFLAEKRSPGRTTVEVSPDVRTPVELSTTHFTAIDLLAPTAESDRAIETVFGEEVLAALERDRRAVVRDIFGARPYHLLPRHQRAFNPYRLYWKYLGGAKIFLVPFLVVFGFLRLAWAGFAQIAELIREVSGKKRTRRLHLGRLATFEVAVRKINRMRKPLFMEAMSIRAAIDVEYLGSRIPGSRSSGTAVTFEEHLAFIGGLDTERREFLRLQEQVLEDLRRFRDFLDGQGWTSDRLDELLVRFDPSGELARSREEVLRALVAAYVTDHGSLRSILTAPEWTRLYFDRVLAARRRTILERLFDTGALALSRVLPRYRRRAALFQEYVRHSAEIEKLPRHDRRRVLARFLGAEPRAEVMLELAVRSLRAEAEVGSDAILEALRRAAFDYKMWTRKLITVRAIQTIAVLDVRSYRDLVWEIGGYAEDRQAEA